MFANTPKMVVLKCQWVGEQGNFIQTFERTYPFIMIPSPDDSNTTAV